MATTTLLSANVSGFRAERVDVEVDMTTGTSAFRIVGLPDKAVEEARERVSAAVANTNADPPKHLNSAITVNLAPADTKKHGTWFDLPIALAFLLESKQLYRADAGQTLLAVGELSLGGELKRVSGIIAAAALAKELGATLIIPRANLDEARLVEGLAIIPADSLSHAMQQLESGADPVIGDGLAGAAAGNAASDFDFGFIRGQEQAKRAMEIAAAGRHNVLLIGAAGTGKTLLARAMPTIMPQLLQEEMLEATTIWSIGGLLHDEHPLITEAPFRAPHHSASRAALVGGGSGRAVPGEVTLAHRGVLFLDELPEFPRHVLEALRQPIEDGIVTVSRAEGSTTYPARFLLLAAQNPCPCGNALDEERMCICSAGEIARYERRVSGPILDRIDLVVSVPRIAFDELRGDTACESSADVRARVAAARQRQTARFAGEAFSTNAEMRTQDVSKICTLDAQAEALLKQAHDKFELSPRGVTRILKVSRTIADLAGSETIEQTHLAEAIQYRHEVREA